MDPDVSLTIDIVGSSGTQSQVVLHVGESGPALGPVDLRLIGGLIEEIVTRPHDPPDPARPPGPVHDDNPDGEVSLYSFDTEADEAREVDNTMLRLVLDLTHHKSGGTYVHLRRMDQTVEYGPIHVQDLPFLIEALLAEVAPGGTAISRAAGSPPAT